jgi:hypothetical protein
MLMSSMITLVLGLLILVRLPAQAGSESASACAVVAEVWLADCAPRACRLIAIDQEGALAQPRVLGKTPLIPQSLIIADASSRIPGTAVSFPKRGEPLICRQWRATSEGTSFSKWGKQVMEKGHEADESDNRCYCSLDICVCGAALLWLVRATRRLAVS